MKEYHEDKISTDVTSCSEERDRTEYHRKYYASNSDISHKNLLSLTSVTTRPLR